MTLGPQKNKKHSQMTVSPFMFSRNLTRGTTTGSYFDERDPDGSLSDVRLHLVTEFADELVRYHEDEDLCSLHGFGDVWNGDLRKQQQQRHQISICRTRGRTVFKYLIIIIINTFYSRYS